MELKEIVMKLVGKVSPQGDASIDGERLDNLKQLCDLVNDLVGEIDDVACRTSYEHSVKESAEYARNFLTKTLGIS